MRFGIIDSGLLCSHDNFEKWGSKIKSVMEGRHTNELLTVAKNYSQEVQEWMSVAIFAKANIVGDLAYRNIQICVLLHCHHQKEQKQLTFVSCMHIVQALERTIVMFGCLVLHSRNKKRQLKPLSRPYRFQRGHRYRDISS